MIHTDRKLRTAISTDGNKPTQQMTDFSREYWPRRSPPNTAADPYPGAIWNFRCTGILQAYEHEVLCWLDYDQHPFYLVAATRQSVLSAVAYPILALTFCRNIGSLLPVP